MIQCQHCSGIGYHSRWCVDRGTFGKAKPAPAPTYRTEKCGGLLVYIKVKP